MSLIPYYLQYVSEISEGTRKAPAGIVLTEQEDLKKALQLQAEITKLSIPAFVKACAEADGTEIPQEEYDSFDPAELNTAIAQLAAASQPQEPAEEAPQEPVRTETRDIFEIFLDSVCLDDALLTYLIDILKRRSEPEFAKLSHAAARTELKLDDFLAWLGNMELLAGEDAPCSADGSRTEPEPACGAEEAEDALRDAEEAALGTLLTLFAAGSVGHSHVVSSSCGVVVESPSSMPGAVDVLSGVFRPERFLSSSSRTVRTAQTPAAAAATRQASSASANPLSRRNFLICSMFVTPIRHGFA